LPVPLGNKAEVWLSHHGLCQFDGRRHEFSGNIHCWICTWALSVFHSLHMFVYLQHPSASGRISLRSKGSFDKVKGVDGASWEHGLETRPQLTLYSNMLSFLW